VPEFISIALDRLAYVNQVVLGFFKTKQAHG